MGMISAIVGFLLMLIGLWAIITDRNIIKIIVGFSVFDTGTHIVIVSLGYLKGKTAPIIDAAVNKADILSSIVDPIPQALVLTAIVIGLSVTALMLAFAIKMYEQKKSLEITSYEDLKW